MRAATVLVCVVYFTYIHKYVLVGYIMYFILLLATFYNVSRIIIVYVVSVRVCDGPTCIYLFVFTKTMSTKSCSYIYIYL